MRNELPCEKYVTHKMHGLEKVNEAIDALHSGECLRAVVKIGDYKLKQSYAEFTQIESTRCFNGEVRRIKHWSHQNQCEMTFSVYVPDKAKRTEPSPPVLFYLSGLTCTDENAKTKGNLFELASQYGLAVVFPDTSARGVEIKDHDDSQYDLGSGAGFYVDATQPKWSKHYNMYSYVTKELPEIVGALFDVDINRRAITGHSMGGHGALTIHLKNPGMFKSVSAFAPITNPTEAPWGQKAFPEYLGSVEAGKAYDACELMKTYSGPQVPILCDFGTRDNFLYNQLMPDNFRNACGEAKHPVSIRMQTGFDHSYYFISTFAPEHVAWHATNLGLHKRQ